MASNTKNSIADSFFKLIKSEEFDKITVTDLVEDCDISRQTFYYHFDDISKMIEWIFERDSSLACSRAEECSNWNDAVKEYSAFIDKYRTLFIKAICSKQFLPIYNLLHRSISKFIVSFSANRIKLNSTMSNNFEFIVDMCANAISGHIIQNISKDDYSNNEIISNIHNILKNQ